MEFPLMKRINPAYNGFVCFKFSVHASKTSLAVMCLLHSLSSYNLTRLHIHSKWITEYVLVVFIYRRTVGNGREHSVYSVSGRVVLVVRLLYAMIVRLNSPRTKN